MYKDADSPGYKIGTHAAKNFFGAMSLWRNGDC